MRRSPPDDGGMRSLVRYALMILLAIFNACWSDSAANTVWMLDDFEDGDLKGASGVSWIVIADDLTGGATVATLDVRPGGPSTSKHALRLSGTLGKASTSFAGAWLPLDRSGRNVDVHMFDGARVRIKGPARLDVGFRAGITNFMTRVDVGPDWTLVDVPFSKLVPTGKVPEGTHFDSHAVGVFGVTTPQVPDSGEHPSGHVEFQIDDVMFYATATGAGSLAPVPVGPPTGLAVVPFAKLSAIPASGWIDLGADPERDGREGLPDATRLEVIPATSDQMLWVRVTLREEPHDRWFGMNLALDVDGDPANGFAWWGANNTFKFDQVVTVWCFHVADGCQGYIGLASAADAAAGRFVTGGADQLKFTIDRGHRAFVLGVPRTALGRITSPIRLVAAVGSALIYGDDVPGQGAAIIR